MAVSLLESISGGGGGGGALNDNFLQIADGKGLEDFVNLSTTIVGTKCIFFHITSSTYYLQMQLKCFKLHSSLFLTIKSICWKDLSFIDLLELHKTSHGFSAKNDSQEK